MIFLPLVTLFSRCLYLASVKLLMKDRSLKNRYSITDASTVVYRIGFCTQSRKNGVGEEENVRFRKWVYRTVHNYCTYVRVWMCVCVLEKPSVELLVFMYTSMAQWRTGVGRASLWRPRALLLLMSSCRRRCRTLCEMLGVWKRLD